MDEVVEENDLLTDNLRVATNTNAQLTTKLEKLAQNHSDETARFESEAQTLRGELEGEKDRVIQLERSIKARYNAGAAVECLTSAKAVKEEEQKSSKLATISDKLCSANNSLKDKEVEIDELRKVNNAISVKLEVTNDELSNANDTLKEKEAIIVAMSHQQDANDAKLATTEQENAAMAAELARVKAELKDLKEKTLLETVCSVASEVISYIPFRKKRKIR